jgi:hypothetical protein
MDDDSSCAAPGQPGLAARSRVVCGVTPYWDTAATEPVALQFFARTANRHEKNGTAFAEIVVHALLHRRFLGVNDVVPEKDSG